MTMTRDPFTNPFSQASDPDRHTIWEGNVRRDSDAFSTRDWSLIEPDFARDRFEGIVAHGSSNPDDWTIAYPTLDSYRDDWLMMSREFLMLKLPAGVTHRSLIYAITRLDTIQIAGDRAAVHKKFSYVQPLADGSVKKYQAQTLYRYHKIDGQWKVVGFVGYLPLPE